MAKPDYIITTIEAGCFDSETIIKDSVTVREDLFAEINVCLGFVKKHMSKRYVITGKPERQEVWEYPPEALREIVINMIVHRDYRLQGDSTIKVFPDRIEFFNPGNLPEGISIQDILSGKPASNPRNKQIASIFKEAGIIEKYESGIKRVRQVMSDAGADEPVFEVISDYFKVTLFPIGGANDVLEYIKLNPGKNTRQIKQALNIPQRTLERMLKDLRNQKNIEFKGASKVGGYYSIKE